MLGPLFDDVQQRFPGYVLELRQVLMLHGLPIGTGEALPSIADGIGTSQDLRRSIARILRGMIRRERELISSVELLAVMMQAAGHPPAQHEEAREEVAIEEILAFILEVRHPREQSGASGSPALLRPGVEAEEEDVTGTAAVMNKQEPRVQHVGSIFGEEENDDREGGLNRRVMSIVAACVVMVALATTFALHQHSSTQQPFAKSNSGAEVAEGLGHARPTIHRPSILRHRGWLTSGSSAHDDRTTSSRVDARAVGEEAASGSADPSESRSTSRTATARVAPAVQPVHLGTSDLHDRSMPAPIERASAGSINRGIVPVDLRPTTVSYSRPDLRTEGRGYVHSASAGIMAGNVVSSPSPAYPPAASSAGVQGEVTVRAVVDRDGNVTDARVVSGPPLLRDAALQAVEQWQYRPYLVDGRPSAIATTAIVDFKLPTP